MQHQTAPNVEEIFLAALEIEEPAARSSYLDKVCGDAELRRHVERLLALDARASGFLASPAPTPTITVGSSRLSEGPGTVIGPYKLMEQIGEGGMGVVYVAEQHQPVRRKVALKIIKPGMDTKQVIARFEAERQALAMMDHPNIAKVHDGGATESGRPYFVMELVRGLPITEYCDGEQLSIRERLELFVQVCRAVQHAHQKGIIHRDLKPSNVLITLHDGVPVPKIIDFGVAKATGQALTEKTIYTAFTQLVGTPLYMSPEQVELSGLDVDTRSDIYSLGVLLYELLTGSTPFDAETLRKAAFDELRRIIREQEPPKPSTRLSSLGATRTTVSANRKADPRHLDRAVRGELDWIVMKALEKDRRRRYETANDFASDVMNYLTDQPVEACPPSAWYRFRKFASRNRRVVATTALIMISGLITGCVLLAVQLQHVSRVRELSQDVRQALAGARTAIEARNLTLADQRVAAAQGRLGGDRATVSELAAEVDAVQREIGARESDESRFQQLLAWTSEVLDRSLGGIHGRGQHSAKEALELFGVLTDHDWLLRLENSYLSAEQKRQVRETAYVTLVSLADNRVRWGEDLKSVERSMDLLRRAEAFHSPTRAFYFVRSECHRRLKNTSAADEDLKRFKAAEAKTAWDYFLPGHTAGWKGDLDEAIRSYRAALALQPSHYNSLFFLALRFNTDKVNRRPEAIQLFTGCIALRPDDCLAYRNRGACYFELGQLDEAISDFREVLRLCPDMAGDHSNLGVALQGQGKLDEAIAAHREAIRLQPDYAGAHLNLGAALQKRGKLDEAIACYHEAIRLQPDYGCAYNNLGEVLQKQGKLDEAIACHKQAIRLGPANHADHHINLSKALAANGASDEAVACLNEALRLNPDDARDQNDIAWFLANCPDPKVRDPARAVELARKAVDMAPRAGRHRYTLGFALYRNGDWEAAIEALEKAEALGPIGALPSNGFFLAMARWQLGQTDEARAWYDKAAAWMENKAPNIPDLVDLVRFRAEAAALLGVADLPADVFAWP